MKDTQIITIFVGPPCVGKTTYRHQHNFEYVISSDDIVTDLCQQYGLTYQAFFQLPASSKIKAEKNARFNAAIKQSKHYAHVAWDLTSLTLDSRKHIMHHYPEAVFKAVVFDFKGNEATLLKRNILRAASTDKFIPEHVMHSMMASYESVSLSEGFSSIHHVQQVN